MKSFVQFLLTVIITLLLSGCERRPLEDENYSSAKIPVRIDWSKAGINPQNVTMLFYDENMNNKLAHEHQFENNAKPIQSYAYVAPGTYTVVVFNELRDQIKNVGVRGHDKLSTLEFYIKENPAPLRKRENNYYILEPEDVAVFVLRGFKVTPEMVYYSHYQSSTRVDQEMKTKLESLMGLQPVNKISEVNITLNVEGLNNARMPALVDLKNISEGYLVNADKNTSKAAVYQFSMNNRKYNEGSSTNGTISTGTTPIRTFGLKNNRETTADQPNDKPVLLDILFMLVDADKTIINRILDVTNHIEISGNVSGTLTLNIFNLTLDPLPVVHSGNENDSGFGSDLEDWNVVEVPITNE